MNASTCELTPESRFFIVNDIDRPEERLIAELCADGKLWYLDPKLRKNYPGMSLQSATPIVDFGFRIAIEDGWLSAELTRESTATYQRDGSPRRWQGKPAFLLPLP